jgi:hypothetical protein
MQDDELAGIGDDVIREGFRNWRSLHTTGPNCHWCWTRPAAFVWCPFGTHVCAYCNDLIDSGEGRHVIETLAASMQVTGTIKRMHDPQAWEDRQRALLKRWLGVRTHAHALGPSEEL